MLETSSCIANRCFNHVEGVVATCPLCGAPMWPSRRWRARGWFALAFGTVVAAATLVLLWYLAGLVSAYEPETQSEERDSALGALILFGVGGLFVALGATMAVTGARQIVTGRRNRAGAMIAFALVASIFAILCGTVMLTGGDVPRMPRLP